jgi:hypothetical protein
MLIWIALFDVAVSDGMNRPLTLPMNAFNTHLFRLFVRYLLRGGASRAWAGTAARGVKQVMVRGLFFTRAQNAGIALWLAAVLRRRHCLGRRAMVLHAGPRSLREHLISGDPA